MNFWDASIRLDLLLSEGIEEGKRMDRITEKLKRASGVAQRLTASLEVEADKLIAREADIEKKTKSAFAPHHQVLDSRHRELDQLEDALKIISNADPLDDSEDGSGSGVQADGVKPPEKPKTESTAFKIEPGTTPQQNMQALSQEVAKEPPTTFPE